LEIKLGEEGRMKEHSVSVFVLITTYLSYILLFCFGHVRDFFGRIFKKEKYKYLTKKHVIFFYFFLYFVFLYFSFLLSSISIQPSLKKII